MFLSAKGISESRLASEAEATPFNMLDDPAIDDVESVEVSSTLSADGSLLPVIAEYARLQRNALDDLLKFIAAFGYVPKSLPKRTVRTADTQPVATFPAEILCKPLEQVQVGDARLGLPVGCIKILNDAGVLSASMLMQHITEQTLVQLPRIGKAKSLVIAETMRAFVTARTTYEENK